VSEYQRYEFVALERPLTAKQMAELRTVSTRAEITPTRFVNEYQWGNFRGDPVQLVAQYFDAHLYLANWGTRLLMLKLQSDQVSVRGLRPYLAGDAARALSAGKHLIIELCSNDEERDFYEDESEDNALAALVPLRTELLAGDLRVAYLAWLLALQAGDVAEDATEPPLPPGLADLTAAQQALVEFLRIDRDLLSAAAAASPPLADDTAAARRWLLGLSPRAKELWLQRALENPNVALGMELRGTFRQQTKAPFPNPQRRAAELLAAAEDARAKRDRAAMRRPSRATTMSGKPTKH
jgi:hypothetical protein